MTAQTYQVGKTYPFTAAQLVRSKVFNVRRLKNNQLSAKEQAAIEELAALILSQGLLQNLIGFVPAKKKGKIVLEIVAGGRRLTAIIWLIEQGKIPHDFVIPVLICTLQEATAISLAENSGREALPPADQFRAFQEMADAGISVEEIATSWGVDEITIKRRLKLANVAPRLFALYEDGNATLDQLMALALTEDHATQEQVWDALPHYQRTHHAIRNLITTQEISVANNKVAKFVGLDEYEKAGGEVRRDLFAVAGEGYLRDAAFLESVAVAKLERESVSMIKGKWAWVDYATTIDSTELRRFTRCETAMMNFSEVDQPIHAALLEEKAKLVQSQTDAENDGEESDLTEELLEKIEAELEAIDEKINALEEAYLEPEPDMASIAGVIVTIDYQGKIELHHGMVRPEDKKELQAGQDTASGSSGQPAKTKSVHSEKLIRQLTAHRTAALQVMLAERTPVALVVLAHKLALSVFKFGQTYIREESAAQISLTHTWLKNESDEIASGSIALEKFGQVHMPWEDRLPTKPKDLFAWLLEQEQTVVLDLLAYCTAYSLNTVQGDETAHEPAMQIGKAVDLDMADWWKPTRTSYFSQVSKHHIISIVASEISAEVAKPLADMKKIPLAEAAEQSMRDTRWLPTILQIAA